MTVMLKSIPIRGVIVLCASVLIHISLGNAYTSGNLIPYFTSYFHVHGSDPDVRASDLIWISTLVTTAQGLFMNIGGILNHYLGPRCSVYIGSITATGGIALSFYTIKYSLISFSFTYAFMYGMGIGLAYMSPITTCFAWFPNHKALVSGIIAGGLGFSGVIFSPVETEFVNPNNTKPNDDGYFADPYLISRVPHLLLLLAGVFGTIQLIGGSLLYLEDEKEKKETIGELEPINDNQISITPKQLFRQREFYLLWITLFLNMQINNFITPMYKAYGQTFIRDDKFLAMVNSISSIFNSGGRVFWGLIMDKTNFKTCMLIISLSCAILLATLGLTPYGGKFMFAVWIWGIFFGFSGNFSIFPAYTAKVFGLKYAGINYGLIFSQAIIGTPLTAVITQNFATQLGWNGLFGLFATCSAISFIIIVCCLKFK